MGRQPRNDESGAWFHVMNRGLAKRTAFEGGADVARFTERLADAVGRKEFEVHGFCVMTTHFHLLVRSRGGLSEGMRRIENDYVRWFNRVRRRDGSLFRGRFYSKLVDSYIYRRILLRYIDFNPVQAGIVSRPAAYPHGSAGLQRDPPAWLCRDWLRDELAQWLRSGVPWHEAYGRAFDHPTSLDLVHIVERTIATKRDAPVLDDLVGASPPAVRAWMERKAKLADGTSPGAPVLGPRSVRDAVAAERLQEGEWSLPAHRRHIDVWRIGWVALLRDTCALSFAEIAQETATSTSTSHADYRAHKTLLPESQTYRDRLARLAAAALARCHGESISGKRCQTPYYQPTTSLRERTPSPGSRPSRGR